MLKYYELQRRASCLRSADATKEHKLLVCLHATRPARDGSINAGAHCATLQRTQPAFTCLLAPRLHSTVQLRKIVSKIVTTYYSSCIHKNNTVLLPHISIQMFVIVI